MKERYDKNTKVPEFRLRDRVLLNEHVVPVGRSPKLVDKYNGPYYITECGPNVIYKLRRCSDQKEVKAMVNASNLRPYVNPKDYRDQPQYASRQEGNQNNAPEEKNTDQPADNGQNDQIADNGDINSDRESDTGNVNDKQNDNTYYQVDKLLKTRTVQGQKQFLVKWSDGSKPTWEPENNIGDLKEEYYTRNTKTGKRRKRRTYFK